MTEAGAKQPATSSALLDSLIQALSGFGGVAAMVLGVLYLVGILVKTVELAHVGLSVQSTLPLFPLEQILRSALTLVWPSLLVLMLAGGLLTAAYAYERRLARLTAEYERHETPHVPADHADDWQRAVEAGKSRSDWAPLKEEVKRSLRAARESEDGARVHRLQPLSRALTTWETSFAMLIVVGLVGGASAFLTPGVFLPCVLLTMGVMARFSRSTVERQLAAAYAVLLAGLIATTLLYPRPLPRTTLVTDNAGRISGDVVLITDSTWYVSVGRGAVLAIPTDHVECSQLRPRQGAARFWSWLAHPFGSTAPSPPTLRCTPPSGSSRQTGTNRNSSGGPGAGSSQQPGGRVAPTRTDRRGNP